MNPDQFQTPLNKYRSDGSSLRSAAIKRDSLAAELERDPHLSTSKRHQSTHLFTSSTTAASLQRQLLAAQTAKLELETKLREKELAVERLEKDRRWLAEREREEREEKEREREASDEAKRKADAEIRSLRLTSSTLLDDLTTLKDEHTTLSLRSTQKISSQALQITSLTRENASLLAELDEYKQRTQTQEAQIRELQGRCDELETNRELASQAVKDETNMNVVRDELQRQASYLRSLETTNQKLTSELDRLRERHTSVEVLREEKRNLERKLLIMEEMRTHVVKLEAEVEAGRREREAWHAKLDTSPSNTPISITHTLSELRLAHARLLEEHGSTTALLRQRETQITAYEQREAQYHETIAETERQLKSVKESVRRREDRALLAEREVTFLQALVASYTAEESQLDEVTIDAAKTERIAQLETLLSEYKQTNEDLMGEAASLSGGGEEGALDHGAARELAEELEKERREKLAFQSQFHELESELKQNLSTIDTLEQTLFELRGEIAGGRHVPPRTRILTLKENPEQEWFDLRQAAMDRLRGENEALMRRLGEIEAGGAREGGGGERSSGSGGGSEGGNGEASGQGMVPRESWEAVNREKGELEELVRQKEKRLLRLQQVFTSKSAEFREAIASLLGLKLAFYPNGQIRVTSVYDLDASFIFQPAGRIKDPAQQASADDGARMQLVAQGEGGPQDLPNLMEYWIGKEQCIAGFIASVTLECYDKSKRRDG